MSNLIDRNATARPAQNPLLAELQSAPKKGIMTAYRAADGTVAQRASAFDAFGRTDFVKDDNYDALAELHNDARKQGGILISAIYNTLRGKTVAPSQQRALVGIDMAAVRAKLGTAPTKGRIADLVREM